MYLPIQKEVLEEILLLTNQKDDDLYNQAIVQSQRWNRLKKDYELGIIDDDKQDAITNRIIYGILGIIDEVGKQRNG